MTLSVTESEELWKQRMIVLSIRTPQWIKQSAWVLPISLIVPILVAMFSAKVIYGSVIAALVYGCYSAITYWMWRSESRASKISLTRQRLTVLLIMGYDGFSLLFLSTILLITAVLSTTYLPFPSGNIVVIAFSLFVAEILFLIVRASYILRYMLRSPERPLAPEMRFVIGSQSSIVGIGVGLGVVFSKSTFGVVIWAGMSLLGALLVLPFGLIALYQVLLLARTFRKQVG